jgi:hypothetical protein
MPPTDPVTLWISQLKEGRRAAVGQLLRRYFGRLVQLARARLRALPGLAAHDEDVALSAFKSLCLGAERGRFPQLDDRADLWRLLALLTVRKAIDLQRRRRPPGPDGEVDVERLLSREPPPELAAELAAGGRAHARARGRCFERLAGTEAYLPVLEALDSLVRGEAGESAARLMRVVAPTWYAHIAPSPPPPPPRGEERLGRRGRGERRHWHAHIAPSPPPPPPRGEERPGGRGERPTAPAASQERMKRELLTLLEEVARLRPLVLFLDDVHWADGSTVDLPAYLGGRCAGLRLLLVLTYRPTELLLGQHPFVSVQLELQRHEVCREVPLGFLGRAEVEDSLGLAFPGHRFPPDFADLIYAKTEGNPLFLVDLLRYLRDRGVLAEQPDGWALAQAIPDFQRELPESVRSLIQKKIAQPGEADRRLLAAAGVQGYEFDSAVVARVLGRDATEVEERLEVLDRVHGLVRLRREQEFPDGTLTLRYQFGPGR